MKIDTSAIAGYAEMTVEEKLAALEAFDMPENTDEIERYKNAVSKANSEAAEFKRKLKEATANSEKATATANSELTAIKEQLAALQREKAISEHKASFLAQGYSEALALDSATALMDNDSAKLFANMQTFMQEHDKAKQAESVGNMQRPGTGVGNPDGTADYQKLIQDALDSNNMGAAAYYMAQQQNPASNG